MHKNLADLLKKVDQSLGISGNFFEISPYPEVTLDTFGFLVGGRLAARRAVFRPRLLKVALFGPKSGFFGQKSIFCPHPPISLLPS